MRPAAGCGGAAAAGDGGEKRGDLLGEQGEEEAAAMVAVAVAGHARPVHFTGSGQAFLWGRLSRLLVCETDNNRSR